MDAEKNIAQESAPKEIPKVTLELPDTIKDYAHVPIRNLGKDTPLLKEEIQQIFDDDFRRRTEGRRKFPFSRPRNAKDNDPGRIEAEYKRIGESIRDHAREMDEFVLRPTDVQTENWITQIDLLAEPGEKPVALSATIARQNDQMSVFITAGDLGSASKIPLIDQGCIAIEIPLSDKGELGVYQRPSASKIPLLENMSNNSAGFTLGQLEITNQLLAAISDEVQTTPPESDLILSEIQEVINNFPERDEKTPNIFGDREKNIIIPKYNPDNQEEYGEKKEVIQNIEVKSIGNGIVMLLADKWPVYLGDASEEESGTVLDWFKINSDASLSNPNQPHTTDIQFLLRQFTEGRNKNNYWITLTDVKDDRSGIDVPQDYKLITVLNKFGQGYAIRATESSDSLEIKDFVSVPEHMRHIKDLQDIQDISLGNLNSLPNLREFYKLMRRIVATEGRAVNETVGFSASAPEYVQDEHDNVWLTPVGMQKLKDKAETDPDTKTVLALMESNQHENNGICSDWNMAHEKDHYGVLDLGKGKQKRKTDE